MNVLIVIPWDQEFGGVTSVAGNLAVVLQKKGHRVWFFNPSIVEGLRSKITKWNFPGYELNLRVPFERRVPIRSTLAFAYYLFPILGRLHSVLKDNNIDIVNIHYPGKSFVYFALLRRLLPFKLVVSVHGADLMPDGKPEKRCSRALGFVMNSADLLVAPSSNTLESVLSKFPHLRQKAIYIHNGINLNEFALSYHGERADIKNILCIAAHFSYKAIDVLIKAFPLVRLKEEKIELRLAGDGPVRSALEELTHDLGMTAHIKFLGWQNREQIRQLLRQCSLLVLPSRAEPFGIVLLEALACRKPVVATNVGGIPEVIQNGRTGVLVPPEDPVALSDAILKVLDNKPLAEQMVNAGYQSVRQHFLWETAVDKYEAAFNTLLSD